MTNIGNLGFGKPMKEASYRESRIARALGEPARYLIATLLQTRGPLQVSGVSKYIRRSQPTVSHHLSILRSLEIVRHETKPEGTYYWIKYPVQMQRILESLREFIQRTQRLLEDET